MKTRVITGALLALVFVPLFIIGELPLMFALILLSMAATYEFYKMFNQENKFHKFVLVIEMALSALAFYVIKDLFISNSSRDLMFAIMLLMFVGAMLLVFYEEFTAHKFGELLVSVLYPAVGFGAIMALRDMDIHNIGFLFCITIVTDVFAYLVGVKFGKHRLAIKISPKKSIEGSIGGTTFAIIFTLIYLLSFDVSQIAGFAFPIWAMIIMIIFISIIGQIGDLVASKMKRNFGIKDYSNIFPGHGGVMDRFDSVIFAGMTLVLTVSFLVMIGNVV